MAKPQQPSRRKPLFIGNLMLVKPSPTGIRCKVWIANRAGEAGDFSEAKLARTIARFFNQEF